MAGRGKEAVIPAWMKREDSGNIRMGDGLQSKSESNQKGNHGYGSTDRSYPSSATRSDHVATPKISADGWSEHTSPDGKVFYYNQYTKQSIFDKPESLMTESERKLPTTDWREFVRDGKIYYFNRKTNESVWEEPMQFTRYKERLRALCAGAPPTKDMESLAVFKAARKALDECLASASTQADTEVKKERMTYRKAKPAADMGFVIISGELTVPPESNKYAPIDDAELAVKEFRQMLRDRSVPPSSNWAEAMTFGIANDSRFHAVKGLRAKQDILISFASERELELEAEQRKLKKQLLEDFDIVLEDLMVRKEISSESRRSEVLSKLDGHPILKGFAKFKDNVLHDAINDYLDMLYDRKKEMRKKIRHEEKEKIASKLASLWENKDINADSAWSDNIASLVGASEYTELSTQDLEEFFKEFSKSQAADEKRRRDDAKQQFIESHAELLAEYDQWVQQELTGTSEALPLSLKEYVEAPEKLNAFLDKDIVQKMMSSLREAGLFGDNEKRAYPTLIRDQFEKVLDRYLDQVDEMKKLLKSELKRRVLTKFDQPEDVDILRNVDDMMQDLDSSLRQEVSDKYPPVVIATVFSRLEREAEKKIEKRISRFNEMLSDVFRKAHHAELSYDEAQSKLRKEREFEELPYDQLRRTLYLEHIEKLKLKLGTPSRDGKRSRSHSESHSPKRSKR